MIATIQCITVRWTKLSRGAPNSAKRAAVPVSFALPFVAVPKNARRSVVTHWVGAYEREDFEPRDTAQAEDLTGVMQYACEPVMFKFEGDQMRADYKGSIWSVGAPARPTIVRSVFSLKPETWGRIAVNGRFGYRGEWTYFRKVLNVAFTAALPAADIFKGRPDAEFRDEHDLW